MSQVNTVSAARSAAVAVGFLGLVAAGFAVRADAPATGPLGAADDYGTRHPAIAQAAVEDDGPTGMTHGKLVLAPQLGLADDFATRHAAAAQAPELGLDDDFGTRNVVAAPARAALGAADDYGTRHPAEAEGLGPKDDYGTRHAR